jgi:microcystin-dependent protein
MGLATLPKTLTAKTEAKAADVMADLNALLGVVNGNIDGENIAESLRNAMVPLGSLVATARATAPTSWLLCQGQAISRTTYAALFATTGTTFGAGDGVTTFNIPDLRGRIPVGVDGGVLRINGGYGTPVGLGEAGGHQLPQNHQHAVNGGTSIESAAHAHFIPFEYTNRHEGTGFNYNGVSVGGTVSGTESASHTHAINVVTEFAGGGNQQNLQPYQVLNWMIRVL